ncbi:MAG: amino acid adenylation domain-containing protein [Acidobacteriota bacterium]
MTLIEVLSASVRWEPERALYTFLKDGEVEAEGLTCAGLSARARSIAAALREHCEPGDRALLLYPAGLELIAAFFGCLTAGVMAVPAYPPRPRRDPQRLAAIARDAAPSVVLTESRILAATRQAASTVPELDRLPWLAIDTLPGTEAVFDPVDPEAGAFLQYTSGSTATPKGVVVTHANLMHNEELIRRAFGQGPESVIVGWLPLYHDMGLIGNVLQPLYCGGRGVLMSPGAFLQRPRRWLEAITRYRATTSGGPNFAYELCLQKIGPQDLAGLDLSSWQVAFNGAEPVRAETMERFAEAFATQGFRRSAFLPCYGLAEATLFVAGAPQGAAGAGRSFAAAPLEEHRVVAAGPLEADARQLVSCGPVWGGQRLVIADPETGAACPAGRVGEIWISGPSVAAGYWGNLSATELSFRAHLADEPAGPSFLRTGDFGFLDGGELFVTGRLKDLIILRGRNLYPNDLELAAERSHPALRAGSGAAFSIDREGEGEESLVLVYEVERHSEDLEGIADAVRRGVGEDQDVRIADLVLVRAGTIPKTSSGKVRRRECRTRYLAGNLAGDLAPLHQSALGPEFARAEGGRPLARADLLAVDPPQRAARLSAWLRDEVGRLSGVDASGLEPEATLAAAGLDSLAGFELEGRLAADLGLGLSGRSLADLSLAELVALLLAGLDEAGPSNSPALVVGEVLGDHPLTSGQEALWLLERSALTEGVYHLAAAARLGSEVDGAALLRAAGALAARHPALRTTFLAVLGEPRQRVHPSLPPDLEEIDATAWSPQERSNALREEARRRFDLERGSPLRVRIFAGPGGERVLLLVLHHLVGDFWTIAIVVRDLAALYAREVSDARPTLPEVPASYFDFVRWQRQLLSGPERARLERYWTVQLQGAHLRLSLPTDRPRPPIAVQAGALLELAFDRAETEGLRALARSQGVTLFAVLLAGFQTLLGRLSGQEELLVGVPTLGRRHRDLDDVVGYFVNPVAMRADLAGDPSFSGFLDRTRRVMAEALEHRDLPFPDLARRLQPDREPGWPPVFQVLFVLQAAAPSQSPELAAFALGQAGARLRVAGLSFESLRLDRGTSQLDLTLSAAEAAGALVFSCEYDTALFDGVTIGRWLGALRTLCAAAEARPEARLLELPLLGEAERHQHLREWNDSAPASWEEPGSCLYDLFEAQARRTPEAPALIAGTREILYGELMRRAERLALSLRRCGVGPERGVGVYLERSAGMVVSLLAILKAGGAYLPLDPGLPRQRLAEMLTGAKIFAVVSGSQSAAEELAWTGPLILVDGEGREESAPIGEPPGATPGTPGAPGATVAENLAYVLFTSGSTGAPKGVAVTHRSAVALVRWALSAYAEEELAGVLAATALSFDLSVFELFVPLSSGGTVILAQNVLELPSLPAAGRVTLVNTVPSALAELVQAGGLGASVRTVNLAGEPLQRSLVDRVFAAGEVERVWNLYGPSEDTTYSTGARIAREGREAPGIGRPITASSVRVLGRGLGPVPPGVAGELYLGGAGLARGYLHRPELTAERFVPDPFAVEPGARLYRTGDLVRWRATGELEFLGRIDHQVKIRGFRIELQEIESLLDRHPAVTQSVVAVRGEGAGRRLVAYLTLRPGRILPESAELRAHLRASLPEYMVPTIFVDLPALPRTVNGKVDRKALPAAEPPRTEDGYLAPRTPTEEVLAGIWAELLGLERVGAADHFFEIGGHSLLAMRLASRLRQAFGVEVSLRDLFAAPRVMDLAARVEAALKAGTVRAAPPLVRGSRTGPLPLSFAQQRLWFIDQLDPGSPLYNVPAALRVAGPLDRRVLARCLGEIVRRHEVLRTAILAVGGSPRQAIQPAEPFWVSEVDLSGLPGLPETRRETLAVGLADREAGRPFDLSRVPLLRGVLLRLADRDCVLALTLHHIASDGWSLGILVREIGVLYPAFLDSRPSPLPELRVQYADFSQWQRSFLDEEVLAEQIAFWRGRLAGLPPRLELPTDRPRPAAQSFRGASRNVEISADLARRLELLSRGEGATLFMTLMAGFQAVLALYGGQRDLAVGTPVAGRNRLETEGLIGFFVNTLVLRGDLSGEPTFRQLISRARETSLAALLHQDVPFEKLVQELAPERSLAQAPLFQAMFTLQNAPLASLKIRDLHLRRMRGTETRAKFDLTLDLERVADGLRGSVEYATDLFDGATVDRLTGHFERLLAAAVTAPDQPTLELSLLDPAEQHQLVEWGGAAEDPSTLATLHGGFEAQARLAPEASAVTFGDVTLSYGELNRRSNRLARWLRRQGIGPESRVGLCLERSAAQSVAILATLKAGGAYVPLDPGTPRDRLAYMIEDAGVTVVIGEAGSAAALPPVASLILVDGPSDPLRALPDHDLAPFATGANLAYVIYTSGSTGLPKGTLVSHGNVTRLFTATEPEFGFGPRDVWTLFHSYAFDFSVWEIWGALLYGGRLVVVPYDVSRSPEEFLELLVRARVTVLNQTPGAFAQLARAEEERGSLAGDLRLVIFGGEALDPTVLAPWFARHGDARPRLVNMYGITETTVHVTLRPVGSEDAGGQRRSLIGAPIADLSLAMMDRFQRRVPIGVAGELVVGGAGLARGYLGRPALTAERFVPDAEGGGRGARLYRSGDLGRHLASGEVEYLGRIDHQVKIRGFRIELGEVEAALSAQAGVREAVVVAREDAPGDRRLVAYVTGEGDPESLRDSLRERLPEYMVPSAIVTLGSLPLNANGKVDKKALPAPEWRRPEDLYQAPKTPVEEILAGIWSDLLGLDRVGANDHFFELGGHSLLATQVMSRVRSAFGVELPLRDLFESPTLSGLAARVETAQRADHESVVPPLVAVPREGTERALPLSFAQQRLWFLDQLEPGSALYNIPAALRMEGPLEPRVLALALGEIVRRHETLRTVFSSAEGPPVQRVHPFRPFALPVLDLAGLPEVEREAAVLALCEAEAGRPFDLARDPLLRSLLLRLAPLDHVVALTTHHIASDGWSMGILVREVTALYGAFAAGPGGPGGPGEQRSPLPELPIQYADYAAWQRSWLVSEVLEEEISYWRKQLAGLPPLLDLPTDRPRPPVQSYRGAARPVRLSADLASSLAGLGRREGATPFMLLLAGFQALLARYSGEEDVAVGSPVAGRNRLETEGLIGFFVNTLVLRGDHSGEPTFRQLIGRVRETSLAAHLHQDVPFEKLVQELSPERSLAQSPLFQVMFALQNAPVANLSIRDLRLRPVGRAGTTAKFDLTLSLAEDGQGGYGGSIEYATDLFDAATVDRLMEHFGRLLGGLVEAPERRFGEVDLLSAEEALELRAWNDTAVAYRLEVPLPVWIEEQVDRTPGAVAIDFEGEELTYRELDLRANRLAHRLRARGCGPESRVGVLLERSAELLVALLGILKAGAAYVPLDPEHPTERLAFQERDAGLRLVLTRRELAGRLAGDLAPEENRFLYLEPGGPLAGDRGDPSRPGVAVAADCPAYVLYTSGSTGRPKGAVISHRAIVNRLLWMQDALGLTAADRVLQKTPFSFDVSGWELFWPLMTGARLVVARPGGHRDNAYLVDLVIDRRITVLHFVPSMLHAFLDEGRVEECTSLRDVVCSGEALPADLARRFAFRLGSARLHNLYGPTEAAVDVTSWVCGDGNERHGIPIGRPIANTAIHLLSPGLIPVPVGVAGELFIGGVNLARGYVDRPDLTADRFLPDPIGGEAGGRLYRTGDLVRRRKDGAVEYLGRLDHQVKIRGFRIELGEIESVLVAEGGAREAVVVARQERPGDFRLVAYVVGEVSPEALSAAVRERLPEYMVPSAFVVLDSLPLTSSGKVDRKALPAPEWQGSEESYQAPRTPVEEILAGIWADLLGLDRVGANDHFFALGGHSLLATQVMSRLRNVFGVEIPLRDLFESPTLSGLAARVETAQRVGHGSAAPPLVAVPRDGGALPLSFAQQRLWFIDQLEPGRSLYNIPAALRIEGELRPEILPRVLAEVVRRHESLRTTFVSSAGRPEQIIGPAIDGGTPWVDLSALATTGAAEARRLAQAEAQRPFDLSRGPLLRMTLLRLGSLDHVALLTLHHIISDAWSMRLLAREIAILWPALAAGQPSPLPDLPIQYVDFARWQREWLQGDVLAAEVAYWQRTLAGVPTVIRLPGEGEAGVRDLRGGTVPILLPAGLDRSLREMGRREGATLFMVLFAIYQVMVGQLTRLEKFIVGSPTAGRDRLLTEGLIGCFANLLPLCADLTSLSTFRDLLQRVRETVLAAQAHQNLPFEKLVEELRIDRDGRGNPLVQVAFTLVEAPSLQAILPSGVLRPFEVDYEATQFDLVLSWSDDGRALTGALQYGPERFEPSSVARMADRYLLILSHVVSHPDCALAELGEVASEAMAAHQIARQRARNEGFRALLTSARRPARPTAGAETTLEGERLRRKPE